MKIRSVLTLLACAVLFIASAASAQVSVTGAINGTVTDTTDAVVPGATVQLKDEGTGVTKDAVTNGAGSFEFRDLHIGTYQITVTLQGFQTALYRKVAVESGRTTDLRVKLAPGGLEQTVTVEGSSPVLEMTSNVISSTLSRQAITELPLAGRNVFNFARLVPGAVAPAGTGSTHFNGLPGAAINPTIDGVNNSSNGFKSGGTSFFETARSRVGAIEEVTVETAGLNGDSGVTGGVNLKFVTRRGSNAYRGSLFEQYRTEKLNANSWRNNARGQEKDELRRHDFGGNAGGPILRDKLFFFGNYEQEYIPLTQTRSQTLLQLEAQQGIFRYQTAAGEQRTVNVLDIARANGFPATINPIIANILSEQNRARQYGAVTSTNNLRTEALEWREPQKQINYYPTVRFDYQIKNNLALMTSYNRYNQKAFGRRIWPLPDYGINIDTFDSGWWVWSNGLNWSINSNAHNELRVGLQHSGDTNERGRERDTFLKNGTINGLPLRLQLPFVSMMTADNAPVIGKHYITTISDTFTLVRGNHTFGFGGNYRDTQWRDRSFSGPGTAGYLGLPRYTIGSPTGDPVQSVFTATTMPGIVNADIATATSLYALLTGRISQVATGRVVDPETGQYSDSVFFENWTSGWFAGAFVQDKWRATPNLTLNVGLRWEALQPPYNHTNTALFPDYANLFGPSTRLFAPGELNGIQDPVIKRGQYAAKSDWNNIAPKVGFAYTPRFDGGILAAVFGKGEETVFRGGYDVTYFDEGTNMFASTAGNNPGQGQSMLIQPGNAFVPGSLSLGSALPPFAEAPATYRDLTPQSELTFTNTGVQTMKDDLETGFVQSWNVGVQRLIMKNTVIEARYLGNKGHHLWHTYNLNEVNIFENGFLNDFKRAQANLAINEANGLTGFANNGLPGQAAIPIFETAFGARGGQAALPANQGFTSTGFITNLRQGEAGRLAGSLSGNQTYICRMVGSSFSPCATRGYSAPGPYPMNFFVLNPYALNGGLNVVDDDGVSRYQALQLQLRRRYMAGLALSANYTLARNTGNIWAENATQSGNWRTLRDRSLDDTTSSYDVRHVFQTFGTYDLPFGKDRHFKIGNPILNAVAGGWTLGGILTAQSGTPFRLTSGRQTFNNLSDSGVVLMNGHTVEEIQSMIKISQGPGFNKYWIDPKLIGPDGRANPEYLMPPTTPGEFGQFIELRGKNVWNLDASLNKTTTIFGRTAMTIHVTMTNVLNHPVFSTPGFRNETSIQSQTFGQIDGPANGARQMYARLEFKF
jgi:hypothetical protein